MLTPDTIPLTRYEGDYEIHMGVSTGKMHPQAGWLTEFFMIGCRTTRGEWVYDPSPQWEHISRIKPYGGENEANIRAAHRRELRHICDTLNARVEVASC
jgi:hypothetical protein